MAVPPHSGEYFIYLKGFFGRRVTGLRTSDSGEVRPIPGSATIGQANWPTRITPDGKFLVAASILPGRLYAFRIEDDGRLSSTSPALKLSRATVDVEVSADGRNIYVTQGLLGKVSIQNFALSDDGVLSRVGSPVRLGERRDSLSTLSRSADGTQIFVSSYFRNELLRMPIEADGTVRHVVQRIGTSNKPIFPIPTPDGRFVYVMNEIGGTISAFRVNDDGVLSPVPGSDVACGQFPHVPAITPDSKYLYTPGLGGSGIHCYEILGDGSLRMIGTAAFGKDFPEALRISPSGKVLWAFGSKLNLKLSTVLRRYIVQPDGRLVLDPEAVTEVDLTSTSGFPMNIVARG